MIHRTKAVELENKCASQLQDLETLAQKSFAGMNIGELLALSFEQGKLQKISYSPSGFATQLMFSIPKYHQELERRVNLIAQEFMPVIRVLAQPLIYLVERAHMQAENLREIEDAVKLMREQDLVRTLVVSTSVVDLRFASMVPSMFLVLTERGRDAITTLAKEQ